MIEAKQYPFDKNVCDCKIGGKVCCDSRGTYRAERPCRLGHYNIKHVGKNIAKKIREYFTYGIIS